MQLVMLIPDFKNMYKDFTMKCFQRVAKELKNLQVEGIDFAGEKVGVNIRFIIADNKGQHEIGGFIRSFSLYFCRYCPMTKTEINKEPWKVAPLRTPESYEEDMMSVRPGRATFKGVSGPDFRCTFNILDNFHVCDPSLCPCVGHDIHLGLLNYDLVRVLKHLVEEKKWFTYDVLNRRIKKFTYTIMILETSQLVSDSRLINMERQARMTSFWEAMQCRTGHF